MLRKGPGRQGQASRADRASALSRPDVEPARGVRCDPPVRSIGSWVYELECRVGHCNTARFPLHLTTEILFRKVLVKMLNSRVQVPGDKRDEARRARMIQRQAFPFVVPPVVRLERLSSPPEILHTSYYAYVLLAIAWVSADMHDASAVGVVHGMRMARRNTVYYGMRLIMANRSCYLYSMALVQGSSS